MLVKTKAIGMLARHFNIDLPDGEMSSVAMVFKTLVEFESPRFLIQEVTSFADYQRDLLNKSIEDTYLVGATDFIR